MAYLKKTDPSALEIANEAYQCFEPYHIGEGIPYANASKFVPEICLQEVVRLLKEIRRELPS